MLDVQFTQPDGSTIRKQVKLGDTWTKFQRIYDQKRKQITDIETQLRGIETEIEALKRQVLGQDEGIRVAVARRDEELAELQRKTDEIERRTRMDAEKARAEDKAAAKAFNKKVKEFWESVEM